MTFLYAILQPYCERKGMRLLNDDFKFIERCLSYIPENAHRAIMRDYVKLYLPSYKKERTPRQRKIWHVERPIRGLG